MNTEITDKNASTDPGYLFYDGDCRFCTNYVRRFQFVLARRGFTLKTLQSRTEVDPTEPDEMRLRFMDGREFGGADAVIQIAKRIWWAWPLWLLGKIPGVIHLLRAAYRVVAANRHCANGACQIRKRRQWIDWVPLVALPAIAITLKREVAPWVFMWLLAFALFLGCKWLTFRRARVKSSAARSAAYLLGWPGMDAKEFLAGKAQCFPRPAEWIFAGAKTMAGIILTWFAARNIFQFPAVVNAWLGMSGIILFLHFGGFHLLALFWQSKGIAAKPLMRAPMLATSLAKFWGERWNTAFHLLAQDLVFRPLARVAGIPWAMLGVFFVSGLIHDLVISLPAGGGYGLPTAYFVLQGLAVLFERSRAGRALRLGHGIPGWIFMFVITAGPAFWLFHPIFIHNVILPMLQSIGAN